VVSTIALMAVLLGGVSLLFSLLLHGVTSVAVLGTLHVGLLSSYRWAFWGSLFDVRSPRSHAHALRDCLRHSTSAHVFAPCCAGHGQAARRQARERSRTWSVQVLSRVWPFGCACVLRARPGRPGGAVRFAVAERAAVRSVVAQVFVRTVV